MSNHIQKCWICGNDADSGEHVIKKSDIKYVFGEANQEHPLRLHTSAKRNIPIASLRSKRLHSPAKICTDCNNSRTQASDRAWEGLSKELQDRLPTIALGQSIRTNSIFKYNTKLRMLNVHLFFVKLFGCAISEDDCDIDLTHFANAITRTKPQSQIYLKLCRIPTIETGPLLLRTEIHAIRDNVNQRIECATLLYQVGEIRIQVFYIHSVDKSTDLSNLWHPRMNTSRLRVSSFQ